MGGFPRAPALPRRRMPDRRILAQQIDRQARWVEQHGAVRDQDRTIREALGVVLSSKARDAFRLGKEPAALRDRYGRTKWGQSLLLARRLREARVRMVVVHRPP